MLGGGTLIAASLDMDSRPTPKKVISNSVRLLKERMPPARVLLIDDCSDNRFIVEAYLEDLSIILHYAETAAIGIEDFEASPFDLVLMDLHMPDMDGFSAVASLRKIERERGRAPLPILAVSGDAAKDTVERALIAGFTAHLAKPLRSAAFVESLCEYLSPNPEQKGDPRRLDSADSRRERIEIDRSDGVVDLATIDPDVRPLLPRYIQHRARDVQRMYEALARGDRVQVGIIGHNMKGTGPAYGLNAIGEFGSRLEAGATSGDTAALHALVADLSKYVKRLSTTLETEVV